MRIDFMPLKFHFWFNLYINIHIFDLSYICFLDQSEVLVDHNRPSPWWQKIRDVCCHSNNIKASYILAVTCKALSVNIFSSQTKAKVSNDICMCSGRRCGVLQSSQEYCTCIRAVGPRETFCTCNNPKCMCI